MGIEGQLKNSLKKQFDLTDLLSATSRISGDGNLDSNIPPTELNYDKGIHMPDSVTQLQKTEKRNMSQNNSLTISYEIIFIKRNDQTPPDTFTVAYVRNHTKELCSYHPTYRQLNDVLRDTDQINCANNESGIKKHKLVNSELKGLSLNPYHDGILQKGASLPQENSISAASRNCYNIHKEFQNDSVLTEGNCFRRNPNRTPLETRGIEPGTSSTSSNILNQEKV